MNHCDDKTADHLCNPHNHGIAKICKNCGSGSIRDPDRGAANRESVAGLKNATGAATIPHSKGRSDFVPAFCGGPANGRSCCGQDYPECIRRSESHSGLPNQAGPRLKPIGIAAMAGQQAEQRRFYSNGPSFRPTLNHHRFTQPKINAIARTPPAGTECLDDGETDGRSFPSHDLGPDKARVREQ